MKQPINNYCGYKPNQKVDQLYTKDDVNYWVGPYIVFDPDLEINCSKGIVKRKLKQNLISKLADHVPICTKPDSRPIAIHKDRIRAHRKDAVTFAHVFGTINEQGIILKGVSFDETEDLSLGFSSDQDYDF